MNVFAVIFYCVYGDEPLDMKDMGPDMVNIVVSFFFFLVFLLGVVYVSLVGRVVFSFSTVSRRI